MVQHPLLPNPQGLPSRRFAQGFGITPSRNPRRHGQALQAQLQGIAPQLRVAVPADGVDPRFVFKIKSEAGISDEDTLSNRGLEVLGHDSTSTYFVLAEDGGRVFAEALRVYSTGADVDGASGPMKSLYNKIDAISLYGPEDRTGPGLPSQPEPGLVLLVDVTIWPSDTTDTAEARMTLLELTVHDLGGEMVARSVIPRFTIARCSVPSESLAALLDLYVIESVRTPPVPFIDPSDWRNVAAEDLEVDWSESASVGLLDDLPSVAHPLLASNVEVVESLVSPARGWNAAGSHGSMIAGLVLNPRFDEDLRAGSIIHEAGKVKAIRVLEPDPPRGMDATRFPPEALTPQLVVDSIRLLNRDHGVRVFNLSFGYDFDFAPSHVGEFSEMLDALARELDIVLVVAAGNTSINPNGLTPSGHHVRRDYPNYLAEPEQGMAQPANAALVLTVGAIATSDAPMERNPPRLGDRAVAAIGSLSPFSRTGPGHGKLAKRLNKPDLVAPGGNIVVDDTDIPNLRDQGTGVLSTALPASGALFSIGHGTSYAVPFVSNVAAAVVHEYPGASANLVRALIASSAVLPVGGHAIEKEHVRHSQYGYGQPSTSRAIASGPQRVTMTFEGEMDVDTSVIHPVPIPRGFALPRSSTRSIRISLAFDPPVRRTRQEYTAATMTSDLYRNVSLERLQELMVQQDPANPQPLLNDRRRVATKVRPPSTSMQESTLQVRDWQPLTMNVDDGEIYFLVLTHKSRTWFRGRDDYQRQRYAVTVTLLDEARLELDLWQQVTQQVTLPARVRV